MLRCGIIYPVPWYAATCWQVALAPTIPPNVPPIPNVIRLVVALALGTVVSVAGVWAYMAHIHGQEPWLVVVLAASMPLAALASLWGFFGSNIVYWVSLAAGFALWTWIGYGATGMVARRITAKLRVDPPRGEPQ